MTSAPSGITGALRDLVRPGDRIFNPQLWGSWFEFALPDASVAIDSRIELFPVDVWNDHDDIVSGSGGWEQQISRLGRHDRSRRGIRSGVREPSGGPWLGDGVRGL